MTELPFCVKLVPSSFVIGSVVGAGVSEDAGACADEPALLLPPPLPEGVLPPPDELPELLLEGPFLRQSQPAGQWASCFRIFINNKVLRSTKAIENPIAIWIVVPDSIKIV